MTYSTRYLYNCSPWWFMLMPYIFALYFKAYMATRNMNRLRTKAKPLNRMCDEYRSIVKHYMHVEDARTFNRDLINEGLGK